MIHLLRRMRMSFVNSGSTRKYALYAIGEIVLVMVGILLALQINNWNEERKVKMVELDLLHDIRVNLVESLAGLEDMLEANTTHVSEYVELYEHIENDLPYSSKLDTAFCSIHGWSSPYLTYTAYETLKNKGIDLVQNESLKKEIVTMYETEFAYLVGDWDRSEWNYSQNVVRPYVTNHIRRSLDDNVIAFPNDFEALKKDKKFSNMLTYIINLRKNGNKKAKEIIIKLGKIIENLDSELEVRDYKKQE